MRKDVRLGMAIGGVLLLLVIVYVIISSFSNSHKPGTADGGNSAAIATNTPSGQGAARDAGQTGLQVTDVAPDTGSGDAHQASAQPPHPAVDAGSGAASADPTAGGSSAQSNNQGSQQQWSTMLAGQDSAQVTQSPARVSARDAGQSPRRTGSPIQQALGSRADQGDSSAGIPGGASSADPTGAAGGGVSQVDQPGASGGPSGAGADALAGAIPLTGARAVPLAPTTAPTGEAATAMRTHVIQPGETFVRISAAVYGSSKYFMVIEKANPGVDPQRLKPGMVIRIPDLPAESAHARTSAGSSPGTVGGDSQAVTAAATIDPSTQYRVQSGDSLYRISEKLYGDSSMMEKIYELNKNAIGPDMRKLKLNMILKLPAPPKVTQ